MAKYKEIEDAFQQIRACSGNSDVKEMVTKFMTREETYAQLHQQVGHFERKYEWLKMKNEEKTAVLNSLKIENDNKKKVDEEKPVSEEADADMSTTPKQTITDGDNVEIEYTKLSAELEQLQSLLDSITERKKNIQLINDQVGGWTGRVAQKIATQTQDHSFKSRASMIEKFRWINNSVTLQLECIIYTRKAKYDGGNGSDDDSINAKDFINEFENDEFKHKNIRVRPDSSQSQGRHLLEDRSEHNSKHMIGAGADHEDDERKFNTDVQHDLHLMRKERKDFLIAQEEKKRAEQEKAEKKKKKI